MKELNIDFATDCEASDVSKLHLNLAGGIDILIGKVKNIIQTMTALDAVAPTVPSSFMVNIDECLYEVSEAESGGWSPNTYKLIYRPADNGESFAFYYVEGKHTSESYLESEAFDVAELLNYLEDIKDNQAA